MTIAYPSMEFSQIQFKEVEEWCFKRFVRYENKLVIMERVRNVLLHGRSTYRYQESVDSCRNVIVQRLCGRLAADSSILSQQGIAFLQLARIVDQYCVQRSRVSVYQTNRIIINFPMFYKLIPWYTYILSSVLSEISIVGVF